MYMHLKPRRVICLLVFLCIALVCYMMVDHLSTDVYTLCENVLDKSHQEVLALIHTYQGEFLKKGDDEFISFASLFGIKLLSVDLRDPSDVVFSFHAFNPEVYLQLRYCLDDQLWLQSDISLTEDADEFRIDNLGMAQLGYFFCKRIRPAWLYCELYLPT